MDLKLEKENKDIKLLKKLFKNKRVALVGTGHNNKNIKKETKEYDIICGVNGSFFCEESPSVAVGTSHPGPKYLTDYDVERIDVLFNSASPSQLEKIDFHIDKFKEKKIKHIVNINANSYIENTSLLSESHILRKKFPNQEINMPQEAWKELVKICQVKEYDLYDFAGKCPYRPLSGTFAWAFLLFMELEELYVDGINFFNWDVNYMPHGTPLIKEINFINDLTQNSCNIKKITYSKNIKKSSYIKCSKREGVNQILF